MCKVQTQAKDTEKKSTNVEVNSVAKKTEKSVFQAISSSSAKILHGTEDTAIPNKFENDITTKMGSLGVAESYKSGHDNITEMVKNHIIAIQKCDKRVCRQALNLSITEVSDAITKLTQSKLGN